LPAAQRGRRAIHLQPRQPDLGQRDVHPALEGPVGEIEVGGLARPGRDPLEPRQGLGNAEEGGGRGFRRWREFLAQDADGSGDAHSPGRGRKLAGNEPDQRGLACAVSPDQACALVAESEGQVLEERSAVRRNPGEAVERYEGGGHWTPEAAGLFGGSCCPAGAAWPVSFGRAADVGFRADVRNPAEAQMTQRNHWDIKGLS
jgi:hypothetical protein